MLLMPVSKAMSEHATYDHARVNSSSIAFIISEASANLSRPPQARSDEAIAVAVSKKTDPCEDVTGQPPQFEK